MCASLLSILSEECNKSTAPFSSLDSKMLSDHTVKKSLSSLFLFHILQQLRFFVAQKEASKEEEQEKNREEEKKKTKRREK